MSAYIFWPPDDVGPLDGFLKFDLVVTEQHGDFANQITSHPVEKGLDVTDNVRPVPDAVTLEVFVSNSPIEDVMDRGAETQGVPLDVPKYEPPLAATPGAVFGAINGALQSAVSSIFGFTPDPLVAQVQQFPDDFDAVAEAHAQLTILRDTAQLLTITTGVKDYTGFVIESFSMTKDAGTGDGASFTINFRQIRIVETKTVKAPVPTEVRGKVKVNKGAKGPVPAANATRKKSIMAKGLGL